MLLVYHVTDDVIDDVSKLHKSLIDYLVCIEMTTNDVISFKSKTR